MRLYLTRRFGGGDVRRVRARDERVSSPSATGRTDSFRSGAEFWKGRIDDVRLYRSALGTNRLAVPL
jgi:hypothetical protein